MKQDKKKVNSKKTKASKASNKKKYSSVENNNISKGFKERISQPNIFLDD